MYFCAQLPCRFTICPLRKNHVPMVWGKQGFRQRARQRREIPNIHHQDGGQRIGVQRGGRLVPQVHAGGRQHGFGASRVAEDQLLVPEQELVFVVEGYRKLTRVPLNEPLRLPRSTSARSPASLR